MQGPGLSWDASLRVTHNVACQCYSLVAVILVYLLHNTENIHEGFGEAAAEIEPETIRQGTQPRAPRDFEKRTADFRFVFTWPAAKPGLLATSRLHAGRALPPSFEPAFDQQIQRNCSPHEMPS